MRISADTNDPGFTQLSKNARVFIDGNPVANCVTADDELGELIYLVVDQNNMPVVNEFDELMAVKLYGSVEIRILQ